MGVVKRPGIGAAISAAFIFSLVLLANSEALAAAQDHARLAAMVDFESKLADGASVSGGLAALGALSEVQSFLASKTFDCGNASALIGSRVAGLNSSSTVGGVAAFVSISLSPTTQGFDNLSTISPFNGSDMRDMDFRLTLGVMGNDSSWGVSYMKSESHLVHLPVRLGEVLSLCEASVSYAASALASVDYPSCSRDALGPEIGAADSSIQRMAAHSGLDYNVTYSVTTTSPCVVSVLSQVWEPGILGPEGVFTFRAEESLSETVETPGSR